MSLHYFTSVLTSTECLSEFVTFNKRSTLPLLLYFLSICISDIYFCSWSEARWVWSGQHERRRSIWLRNVYCYKYCLSQAALRVNVALTGVLVALIGTNRLIAMWCWRG